MPGSVYLGPAVPRWTPGSLAAVRAAIEDGTLTERHWIDVKREVGAGDGARKETARDLASFANHGGALLVGVEEDKATGQLSVAEQDLAGLGERVEQIARSRVDPPLYLVTTPLPGADPARGVLLVEIPPSGAALHQVDGRYWDRGDKTKHLMSDSRVAQLHELRARRRLDTVDLIDAEVARDPVPRIERRNSHLYVVAVPVAARPDLLTGFFADVQVLRDLVLSVPADLPSGNPARGLWGGGWWVQPRSAGYGFGSVQMPGREFLPDRETPEHALLDVELADDGRLSLVFGGGSREVPAADGTGEHVVDVGVLVALVRHAVALAARVGHCAGYLGRWQLAVGVTELRGTRPASALSNGVGAYFDTETYVQGADAVTAELLERPGTVTGRLVARLLRGFGLPGWQGQLLEDPQP